MAPAKAALAPAHAAACRSARHSSTTGGFGAPLQQWLTRALFAVALLARVGGDYTDGLVGWYDVSTFDAQSLAWTDKSSAGATAACSPGVLAATDAPGAAGNSCNVAYLAGTTTTNVTFSPIITALPMSICTVSRPSWHACAAPRALRTHGLSALHCAPAGR